MVKGVYLASRFDRHKDYNIIYNDYDSAFNCELTCDMLDVDLSQFDFILASPPCNYYSRANYRRETSEYAQMTKHLLPTILDRLINNYIDKPFIVENVRNPHLMADIIDKCERSGIFIYFVGRHTIFTNVMIDFSTFGFKSEFKHKRYKKNHGVTIEPYKDRQGGLQVHNIFDFWLWWVNSIYFNGGAYNEKN